MYKLSKIFQFYESRLPKGVDISEDDKRKLIFKIMNKYKHLTGKFEVDNKSCVIKEISRSPSFPSIYLEDEGVMKFFLQTQCGKCFSLSFKVAPKII